MQREDGTTARVLLGAVGCVLLLAGWAGSALAACTHAITLTETQQINFAKIGPIPAGGTVTMSSAGTLTATSGFFLTGTPAVGSFTASGTTAAKNCAVVISFTAGKLTGPGTAMTISNFTDNAGASPKFNASGTLTFNVGAELTVNHNQAGGTYAGTYTVTVVY